jgi:aquaporin Z
VSLGGSGMIGSAEELFERDVAAPMRDFQDPSQEWRRVFSELFGTFLLVLVACGGGVMGEAFPNTISRTAAVTAPGLMVLGIILFMARCRVRRPSGFGRCAGRLGHRGEAS